MNYNTILPKRSSHKRNEKAREFGKLQLKNKVISSTILRFDVKSDSSILSLIPNHKIVYKSLNFKYTFLTFSQNHSSKELLEEFFADLGYSTERIDSQYQNAKKVELISSVSVQKDLNSAKIQVFLDNFTYIYTQKQLNLSIHFDKVLEEYCIQSESFTNFFHVSNFINSLKSAITESRLRDRLILNCIYSGLSFNAKKSLKLLENSLQYIEVSRSLGYMRRIGVVISVRSEIISTQFLLLAKAEDPNLDSEGFFSELQQETVLATEVESNLRMYIEGINHNMLIGRFVWTGNLSYLTRYYSSGKLCESFMLGALVKKDLELLNLHIPNFIKILFKPHCDVSDVVRSGVNLRVQQGFQMKSFELSNDEFFAEIQILKILKNSRSSYLNNRFLFRKTKVEAKSRSVKYFVPTHSCSFEEISKECPNIVVKSVSNLISELFSVNLVFCNDSFPLDQFSWHEEKPVFTYQVPLHKTLQHIPENLPDTYLESTKNSVLTSIIQYHSSQITLKPYPSTQDLLPLLPQSATIIRLPIKLAEERLRLYQHNPISRCIKYYGLIHSANEAHLLSSNTFALSLIQFIENLDPKSQIKTLKLIFVIIEEISSKNSEFCCFDPDSIGVVNEQKLMLQFVAKDEVQPAYKAPEVLSGRSSRSSLIFSFGKIVQHCFPSLSSHTKHKPYIDSLISGCCESKVIRRLNLNQLKILIEKL